MVVLSRVKGIVLCGGKGKRLRPLTFYFQKTMIPIGTRQKPLLEYVVRLLKYHGIEDILLLVDYKAEQIENYFDDGSRFGVRIRCVRDDPRFRGNAGAVYNAYVKGLIDGDETLLIYYGDVISNIDLGDLLKTHRSMNAAATLALSLKYYVSVGIVEVEGDVVTSVREKPPLGKPVTIGVLALEASRLRLVEEILDKKGSADIMGDLIPLLIERGETVAAYMTDAFWYDIGSTEKYEKLDAREVDEVLGFLFKK